MIPTYKIPYRDGELRIGWASWDDGSYSARSIKYAYPDGSGKISRGSPELPFDILVDMLLLAADQKELQDSGITRPQANVAPLADVSNQELNDEKSQLSIALIRLQQLGADIPWADWAQVYNPIGTRLEAVKAEIECRKQERK